MQSADERLMVAHPRGEEGSFSRKIFDQYPYKMLLNLLMSNAIFKYGRLILLWLPVLHQYSSGFNHLRVALTH